MTIVATLLMVERSLAAAEQLAAEGIDAEVIDLRWLRPLDLADRPGQPSRRPAGCVVAEEQVHAAGWGATVISRADDGGPAAGRSRRGASACPTTC